MALARMYLKNLNQRINDIHRGLGGRIVNNCPKPCWESDMIRRLSGQAQEKVGNDTKSRGQDVAIDEAAAGKAKAPSKRSRRGGLWRGGRELFPFHLSDLIPRRNRENPLVQLSENLSNIFENLAPSRLFGRFQEDDKCYKLRFEVPGLSKEELKITIEDGFLVIKGESKEEADRESEEEDDQWTVRSYGYYNTWLLLPEDAKVEEIKAELKNGVLNIAIPRSEERKKDVKEVEIQ
ncbi:hypothetical protein ACLOJK_040335 [Asimina triloba]